MISSLHSLLSSGSVARKLVLTCLASLAPLLLPSCAEDSAGIVLPVRYVGATPESVGTSQDRVSVQLTEVRVGVSSLELVACTPSTLARLMQGAADVARGAGVARARAHSASGATVIGVPVVVDGRRDIEALEPGAFRPPPGRYCGVHGMLRVPDDDALVAAGSPPLNSAVTLAGERLDSAGAVVSTFSLQSSMSAEFDLSFAAPLVLDASLDPSALSSRTLEVSLDGHAWLSAVELPEGELDAAGASALSAAAVGALRVRVMGLDAS